MPFTETPGSPRIILIRHGAYDPNVYTIQDVIKVATMKNDILLRTDDNIVIAGQIGILDLAGVTCTHFMQYNPTFIKKMTMMSEEGSPLRQKQFHYINTPNGFEHVFNVFKSLMQEKNQTSVSSVQMITRKVDMTMDLPIVFVIILTNITREKKNCKSW
jgi:CRAL/TRIO domain